MLEQYIKVKTDFEAIHNWPTCNIPEVSFLKFPHRHKILIEVSTDTTTDRQIEFFMFKKDVDEIIDKFFGEKRTKDIGSTSMETICLKIIEGLKKKYPNQKSFSV